MPTKDFPYKYLSFEELKEEIHQLAQSDAKETEPEALIEEI